MQKENIYYKNFTREYGEGHLTKSKYDQFVCPYCSSGLGPHGTGGMTLYDNGYFCFSCRKSGDIFDLVGHFEGIEGYRNQLQRVKELYGPVDPEKFPDDDDIEAVEEKEAPADFSKYYEEMHEYIHQTDYWKKRGLSEAIINRFGIGFDESWVHPNKQGDGTITPSPRLIIPTSPNNYLARDTRPNIKDGAKLRVGRTEIFNEQALYSSKKPVILVEGEMDAMSVMEVGGEAVALGSTSVAKQFIEKIIKRKPVQPLILAFDDDAAGRKCTEVIKKGLLEADILFTVFPGFSGYHDMNELLCANRKELERIVKSFDVNEQVETEVMEEAEAEETESEKYLKKSNKYFLQELISSKEKPLCLDTGFKKLNEVLAGGLRQGLCVVGGVTSVGKTTFAIQVCDTIAQSGKSVLYVSLEMPREQIIARSVSRHTALSSLEMCKNLSCAKSMQEICFYSCEETHGEKEDRVVSHAVKTYDAYADKVYIQEGEIDLDIAAIKRIIKKHIEVTGDVPVVVIDYIQILEDVLEARLGEKAGVDKSVIALKRISNEFKTPIIMLSSLGRNAYKSDVELNSFKESGILEYGSDVLLALQFRDKTDIEKEKMATVRKIELSVLKNRNGAVGMKIPLLYHAKYNYMREE